MCKYSQVYRYQLSHLPVLGFATIIHYIGTFIPYLVEKSNVLMSTSEHQLTVPDDIGSPQAKLVYLALVVAEGATLTQLQFRLQMSKLTLIPIVRSLVSNEYAQRTEDGYVCR